VNTRDVHDPFGLIDAAQRPHFAARRPGQA